MEKLHNFYLSYLKTLQSFVSYGDIEKQLQLFKKKIIIHLVSKKKMFSVTFSPINTPENDASFNTILQLFQWKKFKSWISSIIKLPLKIKEVYMTKFNTSHYTMVSTFRECPSKLFNIPGTRRFMQQGGLTLILLLLIMVD